MSEPYADPAMVASNFDRMEGDRYWTPHWITVALIQCSPVEIPERVWEPAAGRGDMSEILGDYGHQVFTSDIDPSELPGAMRMDFMDDSVPLPTAEAIITNPPYGRDAVRFAERALSLLEQDLGFTYVAMLMRSEFDKAKGRRHLFGECESFAGEICLTTRPRWDWWFRDEPIASPRHNFSWFIWSKDWCDHPVKRYHYK